MKQLLHKPSKAIVPVCGKRAGDSTGKIDTCLRRKDHEGAHDSGVRSWEDVRR